MSGTTRRIARTPLVLAEVGDGLVIGCEPPEQPHHFQIAMALALRPAARLHAIEIAEDVELEVNQGMIPGRPMSSGSTVSKPIASDQALDERIDDASFRGAIIGLTPNVRIAASPPQSGKDRMAFKEPP